MKQPIHYVKVKARTCATATGRRRSPVAGPSYDAGIPLVDETTNRTIFRQHTDGTKIIFTEIFSSDPDCKYCDKAKKIEDRLSNLWNDLYKMNKKDTERISAYGEIGIPLNLKRSEKIEIAKRIGTHLAHKYSRIFHISFHEKNNNDHIHWSSSERKFENGQFMQKRKKYYLDMDGNLILDRVYKNEHGLDIRQPIIDEEKYQKAKKENSKVNRFDRDENGNYKYQKLGERNKKQWKCDTREGKFLGKKELSEFHNEIDNVINQALKDFGYEITVKRNHPEITKKLKQLHIEPIRIPTREYKSNSPIAEEIRRKNKYNKKLQNALERNLEKSDANIIDIDIAKRKERIATKQTLIAKKETLQAEMELVIAEEQYQLATYEYEKRLEEISIPTPPPSPVLPTFSFTGTNQEKKIQFVKFYNNITPGSSPENEAFLKAVSDERNNHKEIVVNAVLNKLTPDELNEIYNNATEKDKLTDNFAKSYLNRLQKKLKELAYHYGEQEKFDIYFDWSERAKNTHKKIYNQQTKEAQKPSEIDRTDDLILNR